MGKRKRIAKQGFKTKTEARQYATKIETEYDKGNGLAISNNILMKDFINEWFVDYKSSHLAITTRASYIGRIDKHIIPFLGDFKLSQINHRVIQRFYNNLINVHKLKPSSAKKIFDILIGCFKYAKKQRLIFEMPTDIEKIKSEKPKIEVWSKKDIDFFLNSIEGTYLYTPILITILTGVRVAELCGLKWRDVNLDKGYIEINNQVIRDTVGKRLILSDVLKTSTSYRKITIPQFLVDHLQEIKDKYSLLEDEFVIKDSNDKMCNPRNISMQFTKTVARHPKLTQISFHGLRHSHATLLIFNKENIKVVSERLGHKDISITLNTYTHIMDDMRSETATLLETIFHPIS